MIGFAYLHDYERAGERDGDRGRRSPEPGCWSCGKPECECAPLPAWWWLLVALIAAALVGYGLGVWHG